MRISQDALDELGSDKLDKAVEKARNEGRKTVRQEDLL
jgi:histone H3/H4